MNKLSDRAVATLHALTEGMADGESRKLTLGSEVLVIEKQSASMVGLAMQPSDIGHVAPDPELVLVRVHEGVWLVAGVQVSTARLHAEIAGNQDPSALPDVIAGLLAIGEAWLSAIRAAHGNGAPHSHDR